MLIIDVNFGYVEIFPRIPILLVFCPTTQNSAQIHAKGCGGFGLLFFISLLGFFDKFLLSYQINKLQIDVHWFFVKRGIIVVTSVDQMLQM